MGKVVTALLHVGCALGLPMVFAHVAPMVGGVAGSGLDVWTSILQLLEINEVIAAAAATRKIVMSLLAWQ